MIEKSNDQISFRVPDELKKTFDALAKAEGKNTSAVLIAFIEGYVREREEYVASIAAEFGYSKTKFKEKRRHAAHDSEGHGHG